MSWEAIKGIFRRSASSDIFGSTPKPETYPSGKRDNRLLSDEERRAIPFQELRKQTHEEMERQLAERLKTNPHPTEEEVSMGAFVEMIEPQVRNAVRTFRRKGHKTNSSGFGCGFNGEPKNFPITQVIDGFIGIDNETKVKLTELGVIVEELTTPEGRWYSTVVGFYPDNPDLNEMKQKWDHIADLLPDRGHPAYPASSFGHAEFRRKYAPGHKLTRAK